MHVLHNGFEYTPGGKGFKWETSSGPHEYKSIHPLVAVPLRGGKGFLVVEPSGSDAPHNAIIIDMEGSERRRIENPEAKNGAICFSDAYYINEELTLFIAFDSWQMGCVVNDDGRFIRTYEAR